MKSVFYPLLLGFTTLCMGFLPVLSYAQTEQDALMMGERRLCVAGTVSYSSWTDYWEGTFKRDNGNMGQVSAKSAALMLNYGLRKNLNLMATLPYVSTQASQGTLAGLSGFQDLGLAVKWRALQWQGNRQKVSLLAVGGFSTPTNDYNIEFLPMSIGLGSQVLSGRLISDLQVGRVSLTLSGAYLRRGNVEIDRSAYYTDRLINSSEVDMPDAGNFQLRTGYLSSRTVAEAFVDKMTTFGGFDIRKNDMPFVSNRMNSTRVGLEAKHYLVRLPALGLHAAAWHTLAGRNVGQSTGFLAGVDYILDFTPNTAKN
ncbi:hypothetical protein [Pontibacter russatus]|uniref:hypothetical protein n=1 Tax=Pontibacter russatus TaxID=2694929 RepID=UPI00137AD3D6|nr:hypothetical protein [Pontibacter russatus]